MDIRLGGGVQKYLFGALLNRQLQIVMGGVKNDGLIPEVSSDITNSLAGDLLLHHNTYSDYPQLNHSNLYNNQYLAGYIVKSALST